MTDRAAVRVDRVEVAAGVMLGVQTFGVRADSPVLLIAGAGASMLAWDDDVCADLAAGGRFVVRYDQRDTGTATSYPAGAPGYGVPDLVRDAAGLLDALRLPPAHLVGASLGGMVAQLAALDHPDRVASVTLVSTSPAPPGSADDLPPPALRTLVELDDVEPPDWSDRESVVNHLVELARIRAGAAGGFDPAAARDRARREVAYTADPRAAVTNPAMLRHGRPWRARLAGLRVPALVLHGEADPLVPPGHARALAAEIPDAELLILPRAGHDLAPADWAAVLPTLLRHTSARTAPDREPAAGRAG
jgi:pimeloyl-ACP methyl ester carboxylesterase